MPNPTLELEGETGALTGSGAENTLSVGISQEFFLSDKRARRLAVAARELELYRLQLADRERGVRAEVGSAFYDLVLAQQRVALAERAIELNRQLLEVARERLAAGDIPELEMNLVRVELVRSEGTRIAALDQVNRSRTKLWTLMGLAAGEAPAVAGTLESGTVPGKTLAELKLLARQNRPDLKALAVEKGRGEAEIALARAEAVPDLNAGLALTRETSSFEIGGAEGRQTDYTIAVKLSIPLPVFDKNQARLQEARARLSGSEGRLAAAGNAVELEVESAYAALANAEQVLALYRKEIMPQFQENLELTREAYRLGELGILPVFEEQRKFFELNGSYLSALHERQQALVQLQAAVATDLTGGVQ